MIQSPDTMHDEAFKKIILRLLMGLNTEKAYRLRDKIERTCEDNVQSSIEQASTHIANSQHSCDNLYINIMLEIEVISEIYNTYKDVLPQSTQIRMNDIIDSHYTRRLFVDIHRVSSNIHKLYSMMRRRDRQLRREAYKKGLRTADFQFFRCRDLFINNFITNLLIVQPDLSSVQSKIIDDLVNDFVSNRGTHNERTSLFMLYNIADLYSVNSIASVWVGSSRLKLASLFEHRDISFDPLSMDTGNTPSSKLTDQQKMDFKFNIYRAIRKLNMITDGSFKYKVESVKTAIEYINEQMVVLDRR